MAFPDSSSSAPTHRLGIRAGSRIGLVDAPQPFVESLDPLPNDAVLVPLEDGHLDMIICFSPSQDGLAARIATLKPLLSPIGRLWVAWPRKTPGVPLTLVEEHVRAVALAGGLVEDLVSVIDETWTGMRFGLPVT